MSLAGERGKANKLNAEGQDTLNQFKGAGNLAGQASQRERATQQKANHSKTRGAAKEGRNAIKGAAMDSLNSAKDFNNIRKHAQSGDVQAVAKDAATAALKNAARQGVLFLISNPIFWGVVLAFLFLMFIIYLLLGNDALQQMQTNPLQVTITCTPDEIPVGQTAVCTITVTDSQNTDDIDVVATIYPFAQYVNNSASPQGTYNSKNRTVTWDTKKLKIPLTVPITQTFMLTITKTQNNQGVPIVVNASADGVPSVGTVACTATGNPSAEAKWQQVLQLGKQYGPSWIAFLNDARSVAQQQDYPLAVIVGQGALESAHGTSNFARTRNNYFGFEAYTDNPGAAKSYPNATASILDYVNLIKKSYKQAYAARADPVKMVELIKAGGYATDPNYVSEVTSIKEFQILAGITLPCN
jgi:flagellum-specific peptidoglycan hydrolase FlgJ